MFPSQSAPNSIHDCAYERSKQVLLGMELHCQLCGKCFRVNLHLTKHMIVHLKKSTQVLLDVEYTFFELLAELFFYAMQNSHLLMNLALKWLGSAVAHW